MVHLAEAHAELSRNREVRVAIGLQANDRELKLDGYRALGLKSGGLARLFSRNGKDFSARFPSVTRALDSLPDETLIDGEVVAVDERGRPSFSDLQNFDRAPVYYAFDLPTLSGDDLMKRTLDQRRKALRKLKVAGPSV